MIDDYHQPVQNAGAGHSGTPAARRREQRDARERGIDNSARPPGWVPKRTAATPLPKEPWLFAPWDSADQAAWKNLALGEATPEQQKRIMGHFAYMSDYYGFPWRPGGSEGARASDMAAGRYFVFMQVRRMIELPYQGNGDSAGRGGEQGD